jgi:transposase
MSNVTTAGIDLAKNVFSLHGVDVNGAVVLRRTVSCARLMELVAQQPACLIGLEACSGRSQTLFNCSSGKRRLTIEERACGLHQGPSS